MARAAERRFWPSSGRLWLLVLCAVAYLITAPGRITFPDDEIVYQTTASLWSDGDLSIRGIPRRTGEREDRPSGTFGWAPGVDGQRYGFFGHGLSVLALPMYGLGELAARTLPEAWLHGPRRDLFSFHERGGPEDWTRVCVSLTNCLITPLAVWLLVGWLRAIGFGERAALASGLAYALGTAAWPYAGTFLSEPASAAALVAAAWLIARHRATGDPRALWGAGAVGGFSVHLHVLNVLALPLLVLLAAAPIRRREIGGRTRSALAGMIAAMAAALLALGLDQAVRFGSPFETGRYDHYGAFDPSLAAAAAQLVAPGRSVFLLSPVLLLGLVGWRAVRRRMPDVFWFAVAMLAVRWAFVSTRSDWHGGWGVGPRYLVAVLPFGMPGFAAAVEAAADWSAARRRLGGALVGAAIALEAWLASHSIFEWMWTLALRFGVPEYWHHSHWDLAASPVIGYATLHAPELEALGRGDWRAAIMQHHFDTAWAAAARLSLAGHPGPLVAVAVLAGIGAVAALRLRRAFAAARTSASPP